MSWLDSAKDTVSKLFSGTSSTYSAVVNDGRRKSVSSHIRSEDLVLNQQRRKQLSASAMDLQRNVGLAAWAIRQHLNYVALFDFYASSKDRGLNAELHALMERDGKKDNLDIGGRHPWTRFRRLCEVRRTLDGDVLPIKLRSGYLQGIESHQIVDPGTQFPNAKWKNGVLLGTGNRAIAYNVRDADGKDRMVSSENGFLFGCFEGRFDQVRGISSFPRA
ncbi:MAG: phage portal protein [Flavobacteriales bacterium]|nr:phage portal protein [Flavobacteriales bacterium]